MKDINYDLLKILYAKTDTVWWLEKHCIKDAEEAKCHSLPLLKKILEQEKENIKALKEEIKMRMDAGIFD